MLCEGRREASALKVTERGNIVGTLLVLLVVIIRTFRMSFTLFSEKITSVPYVLFVRELVQKGKTQIFNRQIRSLTVKKTVSLLRQLRTQTFGSIHIQISTVELI